MSQGPDIAALLAGAGAGGPPPGGPQDQATPGDQPDPSAGGGGNADQMLRQALDLIRRVAQDVQGEQTTLDAEKITTLIQKMLADAEKEQHDLLQGKMPAGAMVRALSG